MLTMAPLPTWRDLLGIVIGPSLSDDALAKPWRREGEIVGWLSRSAWSLARIALWRSQQFPKNAGVVWVPDYFCNSSLAPLRAMGVKLIFYPINASLQPDYPACRQMASSEPPAVFVLVHYFGGVTPAALAREFCAKYGAWLVEDAAHTLRPISGIGKQGDFVMYSPHKLLPIPDGAVLVARPNGPGMLGADGLLGLGEAKTWVAPLTECVGNRLSTRSAVLQSLVWLSKRTLQKIGIDGRQRLRSFEETGAGATNLKFNEPTMSWLAHRLLSSLIQKLADAGRWRQRNLLLLDELLSNVKDNYGLMPTERSQQYGKIPYLACFKSMVEDAEAVYRQLQQQGMPVMTWPDLAPEVVNNRQRHKNAWMLRHQRIYLPLHQSIRAAQLIASTKNLKVTRANPILPVVRLDWGAANRSQWHEWMTQAGPSNLLQSWEYGDAKAGVEGWCVRRGVFFIQDEPFAIVQALEKRLLGMVRVVRINRGPLFLKEMTISERTAIFDRLCADMQGLFKTILFFSPDLILSGENIRLFTQKKFRQFGPATWMSSWIDLRRDEEDLRKLLHAKWRNMLVKAEKQEMHLHISSDTEDFEWLLDHCANMMLERGVSPIPVGLYRALWKCSQESGNPLFVLRAFDGKIPIAGICVIPHGIAATYLLGWNDEVGRRLNANYLLLWQAVLCLKRKGFSWFDLGGLNYEKTPGISAFKQGMNGNLYELVGRFWR